MSVYCYAGKAKKNNQGDNKLAEGVRRQIVDHLTQPLQNRSEFVGEPLSNPAHPGREWPDLTETIFRAVIKYKLDAESRELRDLESRGCY